MDDSQGLSENDTFYSLEPNSIKDKESTETKNDKEIRTTIPRARTSESEMALEGLETVSLDASVDASIQLNAPQAVVTYESNNDGLEPKIPNSSESFDTTDRATSQLSDFPSVRQYFEVTQATDVAASDPKTFFDSLSAGLSPMMKSVADITALDDKEVIEIATQADEEVSATLSCPEIVSEDGKASKGNQSLQSLFNEDKFGSDVVGKAFFDSLAGKTEDLSPVVEKTIEKSSDVTPVTTENIFAGSPASSPESFFSDSSEKESYYDTWIPCQKTQLALRASVTSPPGTYFPDKCDLTMPGVIIEDNFDDPVKTLLADLNLEEAKKRQCLTADIVSQDDKGLLQLIRAKCYHAALNLTNKLLASLGQGPGKGGHPSKHTPYSLQLWFTRLTIFVKLRKFSFAEVESVAFGDLDRPDIYYEFYPEVFPGKKGSMASFSFRLLLASLPQYQGNYHGALDRLYALLEVIKRIINFLNNGLAEDGSMMELSESHRKGSLKLWKERECRTLYFILNCMVTHKDYVMAIKVAKSLIEKDQEASAELHNYLGKIYLQLGDIHSANDCFVSVSNERLKQPRNMLYKVEELVNKALMCIVQNSYSDAYKYYKEAYTLQPKNAALANNMSVCLLYMGKLKESLATLEQTIFSDPKKTLHEGVLFNTCILYELESTNSVTKKEVMLKLAAGNCGDAFQTNCLKIDATSVRDKRGM